MEQNVERVNRYFAERIAQCEQRNRALLADERMDEAVFEKVKANIYDVFRTVFAVAVKTGGDDPDAARRFFDQKAEQIPASWAMARDQARQHQDTVKMRVEQIKLDTAEEVRQSFARIWEATE